MALSSTPDAERPPPLNAIRRQFFFTFFVMGALVPYLPVWLQERGLTRTEIGQIQALPGIAVLVAPVLLTLLADTRWSNRRTLAVLFAVGGAALAGLLVSWGFWVIAAVFLVYNLAKTPIAPLQDGLFFRAEADRMATLPPGAPHDPKATYHRIRAWGTGGFIVAAALITPALLLGGGIDTVVWAALLGCGLGLANAATLGTPERAAAQAGDADRPQGSRWSRLPTAAALRQVMRPPLLTFFIAMWLIQFGVAAYYAFYPLYLTELLALDPVWVGPITNLGVVIELFMIVAFGRLVARFGLRNVMLLGMVSTVLRFGLLAVFVNVPVAVGLQLIHGLMVLVVHVMPPMFLNRHAEAAYRNSIQGVYAMLILGTARALGSWGSGVVADTSWGYPGVFGVAAVICAVGGAVLCVPLWRMRGDGPSPT